jgi:hypothetical protein
MKRRVQLLGLVAIGVGFGLAVVDLGAYATNGHVWGTTQISYFINPSNLYVSQADAIADIQQAASDWNTQAGVNARFAYAGATNANALAMDHTNNVFFRNDASGYIAETYWWWDGSGRLIDADVVFHENYKFYARGVGCAGDGYYVANTLAHEFGHALGLGHSSVDTATMYATEGACETAKESLDADDVAGIQSLYPASTSQPPAAPAQLTAAPNALNPTGSLALAWSDLATNENGYRIDRSTDGLSFGQVAQVGSNAGSYVDNGLAAASNYFYRVYAYNSAGSSGYSDVAAGLTAALTSAPAVPASPSPANGATSVSSSTTLRWTSSNAQRYDVYISGALFAADLTSSSLTVSSLATGSTYSWNVVAKNMIGSTSGPAWTFSTQVPNPKKGGSKH